MKPSEQAAVLYIGGFLGVLGWFLLALKMTDPMGLQSNTLGSKSTLLQSKIPLSAYEKQ